METTTLANDVTVRAKTLPRITRGALRVVMAATAMALLSSMGGCLLAAAGAGAAGGYVVGHETGHDHAEADGK